MRRATGRSRLFRSALAARLNSIVQAKLARHFLERDAPGALFQTGEAEQVIFAIFKEIEDRFLYVEAFGAAGLAREIVKATIDAARQSYRQHFG
jgi:hypothetical protein